MKVPELVPAQLFFGGPAVLLCFFQSQFQGALNFCQLRLPFSPARGDLAGLSFKFGGRSSLGLVGFGGGPGVAGLFACFGCAVAGILAAVITDVPAAALEMKRTGADDFFEMAAALGTNRQGRLGEFLPFLQDLPARGALILIDGRTAYLLASYLHNSESPGAVPGN